MVEQGHCVYVSQGYDRSKLDEGSLRTSMAEAGKKCVPMASSVISFAILTAPDFQRQFWNQRLKTRSETGRMKRKQGGWWSDEGQEELSFLPSNVRRVVGYQLLRCDSKGQGCRETDPDLTQMSKVRVG